MHRTGLAFLTIGLFASALSGCSNKSLSTLPENLLTIADRAWCSNHPQAHAEAAALLDISFIADYVRSSDNAMGPKIADLEPPFLAIPSGDNELLTYQVQFRNQADSDKACSAAINEVD